MSLVVLPAATEETLKVVFRALDREPTLNNVTVLCALLAEGTKPKTDQSDFTITTTNSAVTTNANGTYDVTVITETIGSSDNADVSKAAGDWDLYARFAHTGWDDLIVEGPVTVRIG